MNVKMVDPLPSFSSIYFSLNQALIPQEGGGEADLGNATGGHDLDQRKGGGGLCLFAFFHLIPSTFTFLHDVPYFHRERERDYERDRERAGGSHSHRHHSPSPVFEAPNISGNCIQCVGYGQCMWFGK